VVGDSLAGEEDIPAPAPFFDFLPFFFLFTLVGCVACVATLAWVFA
jgi:hypothetical protein